MHHIIYRTTNLVNGKMYIGSHSTENLDDGYMGSGKALKLATAKYGRENFITRILGFYDSIESMHRAEETLLRSVDAANSRDYYNIKNDAVGGGGSHSEETRAKISAAIKGRKHSPVTIAKISASMTGKTPLPETREKISKSLMGNKPRTGWSHTAAAKAKVSAANKGRVRTPAMIARMSAAKKGKPWSAARREAQRRKA